MKHIPRILAAFDLRSAWTRDVLTGIASYAEKYGPWNCDFNIIDASSPETIRRNESVDGVIVWKNNAAIAAAVAELKMPVVTVGPDHAGPGPRVVHDEEAIGQMAAEHLIERGFRRFAYCAFRGAPAAVIRGREFVKAVESFGYSCEWFQLEEHGESPRWQSDHRQLVSWVKKLTKPVAVFVVTDAVAWEVAQACGDAGVFVPRQIALLGAGNIDFYCRICMPPLSSVQTNATRMGFEAAQLLHRLLNKQGVPANPILIPPVRVVIRESTDIVSVADPMVARAVEHIQRHLSEGVNVKQLVRDLDIGRRTLELAFRRALGRTVHAEIVAAQLQLTLRLLEHGDKSLPQIAASCGIRYRQHLNNFVKKHLGITPIDYQKRYQHRKF